MHGLIFRNWGMPLGAFILPTGLPGLGMMRTRPLVCCGVPARGGQSVTCPEGTLDHKTCIGSIQVCRVCGAGTHLQAWACCLRWHFISKGPLKYGAVQSQLRTALQEVSVLGAQPYGVWQWPLHRPACPFRTASVAGTHTHGSCTGTTSDFKRESVSKPRPQEEVASLIL